MNIVYNKMISKEENTLFKLMKEFVYTYLTDKSFFEKITIYFEEIEDKNNGLSYVGLCTFKPNEPFKPIIKISNYAIRLSSQAYMLSNKTPYDSYEKYRYHIIFHELAHIVCTYNDLKLLNIMIQDDNDYFNKEEENICNKLSDEFLKSKSII